jgi:transcription-repair coupling factor (superfamily II helicase)
LAIAHKTKIYFPKTQANQIISFVGRLQEFAEDRELGSEKWKRDMFEEIGKMLESIEDECRALLNVEAVNEKREKGAGTEPQDGRF